MDDYAAHAQKQIELDTYSLRQTQERIFAHILTSKLALFHKKSKELLQKTVPKATFENLAKSKVLTSKRKHGKKVKIMS